MNEVIRKNRQKKKEEKTRKDKSTEIKRKERWKEKERKTRKEKSENRQKKEEQVYIKRIKSMEEFGRNSENENVTRKKIETYWMTRQEIELSTFEKFFLCERIGTIYAQKPEQNTEKKEFTNDFWWILKKIMSLKKELELKQFLTLE